MTTPDGPWQGSPPAWGPPAPPGQHGPLAHPGAQPPPWGMPAGHGRAPVPGGGTLPRWLLPALAIGSAVLGLLASFLPHVRFEVGEVTVMTLSGWQQRFTYEGEPSDSVLQLGGTTLLLAAAALVTGALVGLLGGSSTVGLALQAAGAALVLGYEVRLVGELMANAVEGGQGTTVLAGTWLMTVTALTCLALLVLALRDLAVLGRRAG